MRWILDACTLIYLVKAKLFKQFIELTEYPIVIDSSVYEEVIINGKINEYPDAFEAEELLKKYKIPIIPIDIDEFLYIFKDAGETSCYILAKDEGICLTSDDRAYKKFCKQNENVLRLDTFYYQKFKHNIITKKEFIAILVQLESVNATKPKSILYFIEKMKLLQEDKKDD